MSRDSAKPSKPIPISNLTRGRARAGSLSSASSGSSSELQTPMSASGIPNVTIPSPGSSPILSYFLAQSPSKSPATSSFPFRKFSAPVFEDDEMHETPSAMHTRRASTAVAGRFAQQNQNTPLPEPHVERGAGVLRRLSLSSASFMKPSDSQSFSPQSPPLAPPNSAVSPTAKIPPFSPTKPRRATTLSVPAKQRRAPSPMGERMLKGHFDGFN